MPIAANSRYALSKVIVANDLDGNDILAIVPGVQGSYSFRFTLYYVKTFDTLATLAYANYGSALLWWRIADANPEVLLWDTMPVGTYIRIPVSG